MSLVLPLLLSGAVWAQSVQAAPQDVPTQVEDVLVLGRSRETMRDRVTSFVEEVTAPPNGRGVSRWNSRGRICVGAANIRNPTAQFLVDRVSEVGAELGLEVEGPGCSPNILIIGTEDAISLAQALAERSPNAFRPRYSGAAAGRSAFEKFKTRNAAVRWWHVSMPVQEDSGQPAVRLPGEPAAPLVANRTPGRLRTPIRNDLRRSIIIVDMPLAEGVKVNQLADYVAMAAYAQIDPDADVSRFDTILNLFNRPAAELELTGWDRAYLQSVYAVERNERNPNAQVGSIGSAMIRDRRSASEAD